MQEKITNSLLKRLKPKEKAYEIYDTELKGFTLRIQPSGAKSFLVRFRWEEKQTRRTIGSSPPFTPHTARKEAERILSELKLGKSPLKRQTDEMITLETFLDEKKGEYAKYVLAMNKDGKNTLKRLKSCFSAFLDKSMKDITFLEFENYISERLNDGISPNTINRDFNALKPVFSKAIEWEYINESPAAKIKALKSDSNRPIRFLSDEEELTLRKEIERREKIARLKRESHNRWMEKRNLPALPSLSNKVTDHLKPMILLSLNTGIRRGELFKLRIGSIDLKNKNMIVHGGSAKSGNTRHIPLNEEAHQILDKWIPQLEYKGQDGLVFPNKNNQPFTDIKTAWHSLRDATGISDFRWHDLRHTFASNLVMKGVDLNTVRELLGHSDLKMTLRYAHLAPKHKAEAVARLCK